VCLSGIAVLCGAFDAGSAPQAIATIPEIIWEASLGIYLTVKGFKSPVATLPERRDVPIGGSTPAIALP
jgi:hypothetical protein